MNTQKSLKYRHTCAPLRYKMIELARVRGVVSDTPTHKQVQEIFKKDFDELQQIASKLEGYVYKWRDDAPKSQHDKDIIKQYEKNNN